LNPILLLAHGGPQWIAGVQYLHSLLAANALLPEAERATFDLLLHGQTGHPADYADVRSLVRRLDAVPFLPTSASVVSDQFRYVLRRFRQVGFWSEWPSNCLPELLREREAGAVFPANERVQRRLGARQISWIPDFQHEHLPQFFSGNEIRRRRALFARFVRQSDRVVVSNRFSLDDAHRIFPEQRDKFVLLPFTMTLGEAWREPDPSEIVRKFGLPEKFLLLPSQFWKHKNHPVAFEAVRILRERGLTNVTLVCTGHPHDPRFPTYADDLTAYRRQHLPADAVRVLGLLPRADQVQLLRAAAAIVQPSLFEGWSALLEDCRSAGKTVFASNIPMHHEQLTARTVLFNPHSPTALADAIAERWDRLPPGPAPDEPAAEQTYRHNLADFARRFISLIQTA
jgi:glycosyltransferase involved in cell wall biosynthesis